MPSSGDTLQLLDKDHALVRKIVARLRRRLNIDVGADEMEAAGLEGLVQARRNYDPERGVAFSTFAYHRIRGAILDDCRRLGLIKRNHASQAQFEAAASEVLRQYSGGAPAPSAQAETGQMVAAFDSLASAFLLAHSSAASNPRRTNPHRHAEARELVEALHAHLAELSDEEQSVLRRYYFENESMAVIAEDFGVSKSWVSRVHTRSLDRLRALFEPE